MSKQACPLCDRLYLVGRELEEHASGCSGLPEISSPASLSGSNNNVRSPSFSTQDAGSMACPMCGKMYPVVEIEGHVNYCMEHPSDEKKPLDIPVAKPVVPASKPTAATAAIVPPPGYANSLQAQRPSSHNFEAPPPSYTASFFHQPPPPQQQQQPLQHQQQRYPLAPQAPLQQQQQQQQQHMPAYFPAMLQPTQANIISTAPTAAPVAAAPVAAPIPVAKPATNPFTDPFSYAPSGSAYASFYASSPSQPQANASSAATMQFPAHMHANIPPYTPSQPQQPQPPQPQPPSAAPTAHSTAQSIPAMPVQQPQGTNAPASSGQLPAHIYANIPPYTPSQPLQPSATAALPATGSATPATLAAVAAPNIGEIVSNPYLARQASQSAVETSQKPMMFTERTGHPPPVPPVKSVASVPSLTPPPTPTPSSSSAFAAKPVVPPKPETVVPLTKPAPPPAKPYTPAGFVSVSSTSGVPVPINRPTAAAPAPALPQTIDAENPAPAKAEPAPPALSKIHQLIARATISPTLKDAGFKKVLVAMKEMLVQASRYYLSQEYDESFILYYKFTSVISTIVPKLEGFQKEDTLYVALNQLAKGSVLQRLEKLKDQIKGKPFTAESFATFQREGDELEAASKPAPPPSKPAPPIQQKPKPVVEPKPVTSAPKPAVAAKPVVSATSDLVPPKPAITAKPKLADPPLPQVQVSNGGSEAAPASSVPAKLSINTGTPAVAASSSKLAVTPVTPSWQRSVSPTGLVNAKPTSLTTAPTKTPLVPPKAADPEPEPEPVPVETNNGWDEWDNFDQTSDARPANVEDANTVLYKAKSIGAYDARTDGELSLAVDDVVEVLESDSNNDDWLYARCNGVLGFAPANYLVKIELEQPLPSEYSVPATPISPSVVPPKATQTLPAGDHARVQIKFKTKAIQDFTTTAAGHLSFKTGDELEVLSELGDNYLARLGANKGMVESRMTEKGARKLEKRKSIFGMFGREASSNLLAAPSAKELPQLPPSDADSVKSADSDQSPMVSRKVIFNYDGESDGDLAITAGEVLYVAIADATVTDNLIVATNSAGKVGKVPGNYLEEGEVPAAPLPSHASPTVASPSNNAGMGKKQADVPAATSPINGGKNLFKQTMSKIGGLKLVAPSVPTATAAPSAAVRPPHLRDVYIAKNEFLALKAGDLTVSVNDQVDMIENDDGFGWCKVTRIADGATGQVPCDCLEKSESTHDAGPQMVGGPKLDSSAADALTKFMDNWERLAGPTEVQRRASEKKRQVKIYEILDTWSNFVEQMRELCEEIVEPLKNSDIFSPEELKDVQTNVFDVRRVTDDFYGKLYQRIVDESNYSVDTIGDVLVAGLEEFKVFTIYCLHLSRAVDVLSSRSKNDEAFTEFVEETLKKNSMSLTSLFTQPFNRLTKLRLQIYDLAKVTPTTTRDYEDCLLAQAQVQDVCDDVNTLKHLHDDVFTNTPFDKKLHFDPLFMAPSRRTLLHYDGLDQGSHHFMGLFFDDCVLFVNERKEAIARAKSIAGDKKKGKEARFKIKLTPLFLDMIHLNEVHSGLDVELIDKLNSTILTYKAVNARRRTRVFLTIHGAKHAFESKKVLSVKNICHPPPKTSATSDCIVCAMPEKPADRMYIQGTDQGLYLRRLNEPEWHPVLGVRRKVAQVEVCSTLLVAIAYDSKEGGNAIVSLPMKSLGSDMIANEVKATVWEGSKNAVMFQNSLTTEALYKSIALINGYIWSYSNVGNSAPTTAPSRIVSAPGGTYVNMADSSSIVVALQDNFAVLSGTVLKAMAPNVLSNLPPKSTPITTLRLETDVLLCCCENFAFLSSCSGLSYTATPVVWTAPASSFTIFGDYLLVATALYIEVRHLRVLPVIVQLIPAAKPILFRGPDGLFVSDIPDSSRELRQFCLL